MLGFHMTEHVAFLFVPITANSAAPDVLIYLVPAWMHFGKNFLINLNLS